MNNLKLYLNCTMPIDFKLQNVTSESSSILSESTTESNVVVNIPTATAIFVAISINALLHLSVSRHFNIPHY